MGILIGYPWLALVNAGCFVGLWSWRRTKTSAIAAIAWAAYGGYEYLMLTRVLCTGECNIRVDLLRIYPLLLTASIIAIIQAIRARGP